MATRIDLTPRNITSDPLEPIEFFNHLEAAVIPEEEIRILRDVQTLHNRAYKESNPEISLKILKIRIVKFNHSIGLKFAKDIVEYLDAKVL